MLFNLLVFLYDSTFKLFIIALTSNFIAKSEHKNIKNLMKIMQSLIFSVYII